MLRTVGRKNIDVNIFQRFKTLKAAYFTRAFWQLFGGIKVCE